MRRTVQEARSPDPSPPPPPFPRGPPPPRVDRPACGVPASPHPILHLPRSAPVSMIAGGGSPGLRGRVAESIHAATSATFFGAMTSSDTETGRHVSAASSRAFWDAGAAPAPDPGAAERGGGPRDAALRAPCVGGGLDAGVLATARGRGCGRSGVDAAPNRWLIDGRVAERPRHAPGTDAGSTPVALLPPLPFHLQRTAAGLSLAGEQERQQRLSDGCRCLKKGAGEGWGTT